MILLNLFSLYGGGPFAYGPSVKRSSTTAKKHDDMKIHVTLTENFRNIMKICENKWKIMILMMMMMMMMMAIDFAVVFILINDTNGSPPYMRSYYKVTPKLLPTCPKMSETPLKNLPERHRKPAPESNPKTLEDPMKSGHKQSMSAAKAPTNVNKHYSTRTL